jgi:hypothetical protein
MAQALRERSKHHGLRKRFLVSNAPTQAAGAAIRAWVHGYTALRKPKIAESVRAPRVSLNALHVPSQPANPYTEGNELLVRPALVPPWGWH